MDSTRQASAPSEISIRRAANGGHIVRHSFDNFGAGESYRPSQEHAFSDHKSMLAHVAKHTKGGFGSARPTGIAGRAKAAPPTIRTRGAGAD